MRHVTDGDLHAYLDGGLELYPDGEAERLRAHVEECATCQERLETERALRERADGVLALADPGPVDAPPFEELRRRAMSTGSAGGSGAGGGWSRAGALRTAAVAVVALGVGWLAGRQGPTAASLAEADGGRVAAASAPSEAPGSSGEAGTSRTSEVPAPSEASGPQEPGAPEAAEASPVRTAPTDTSPVRVAGREAERAARERTNAADAAADAVDVGAAVADAGGGRAASPEDVASDAPAPARNLVAGEDAGERAGRPASEEAAAGDAAPERTGPAERTDSLAAAAAPELVPDPTAQPRVRASDAPPEPTEQARSAREELRARAFREEEAVPQREALFRARPRPEAGRDGRRLTVPGLTVVSVEWTEVAPGEEGLRVVQRLAGGEVLELRFGGLDGSETAPGSLLDESLPDDVRQVVVPFGDGWLVARAPLADERIRALLARIR